MVKTSYGKSYAHRNKQHFKTSNKTKKCKKEEERMEMESIIARYGNLPKANTSLFKLFTDFPLSKKTLGGLEECEYVELTDIQRESLPFSLSGSDIVGAAKTGSGKTLALIIPVLECLWRSGWSNYCGLGAIIISPTRELALQTFTVINHVGKYHEFSCALLIGGTDVDFERNRIGRVNIIICTPGRLLQHMDENQHLSCDQLEILVIDEADRILDMGFTQQINAIVANLPRDRQTLLFSATQTRSVKDLSRVCTKDPVFVSAHERCAYATPDRLKQSYMVCEEHDKVNIMWSFIVNHRRCKIIMFVSSCKQARFLTGAFCHLRPGLPVMGLWGTMNQKKRVDVFQKFENKEAAVMIATDVASRGLDFSGVDWVIQVDCPATAEDYIHRVGRTARMNEAGHAILFLTPSQENGMIALLDKANIPLKKQIPNPTALVDIRPKMQAVLSQFSQLNQYAQKSVVSYLRSIYIMRNKKVFDVTAVDVNALALSYGLVTVPRVRFLNKSGGKFKDSKCTTVKNGEQYVATGDKTFEDTMQIRKTDVDDKDDNVLMLKRVDVFNSLNNEPGPADNVVRSSKALETGTNIKVITKLAAAKKMLNKKVKVNVRKLFNEHGELIKVDGVQNQHEGAGLDLSEAIESMKKDSAEDKKRYKTLMKERKKEKERLKKKRSRNREDIDMAEGSSGIDSDADLSFLPDPDEVCNRYKVKGDDEQCISNDSNETSSPLQKRRKQRKELADSEKLALALLNPF